MMERIYSSMSEHTSPLKPTPADSALRFTDDRDSAAAVTSSQPDSGVDLQIAAAVVRRKAS